MSQRKYIIRKAPGDHLTREFREILGRAWNGYIGRCRRISLRKFAELHNIPYETWRRGNEWIYAEYDAEQATASVNEGKSNMGARMKLTMPMAIIFRYYVTVQRRSPYDARLYVVEALPGMDVPCLRTFYNHIEAGDMGVHHGDAPYHPGKRRRQRIPARLDRAFKAEVYYTRAYASYEKGSVENCNRIVRRWFPKGTNFKRLHETRDQVPRGRHQLNPQTVTQRRNRLCVRFTHGLATLMTSC